MALFSILKQDAAVVGKSSSSGAAANDAAGTTGATSSHSNSQRRLATVVQLYAKQPSLPPALPTSPQSQTQSHGVHNTNNNINTMMMVPYALLTYQAVATTDLSQPLLTEGPSLRKSSAVITTSPPDLGIWNCKVFVSNQSNTKTEQLLHSMETATASSSSSSSSGNDFSSFTLTVDLQPAAAVEPTLTALQNALIRYLTSRNNYEAKNEATITMEKNTATTTLAALRAAQFGLAVQDSTYTPPTTTADESDNRTAVRVMIVVRMTMTMKDEAVGAGGGAVATGGDDYLQQQHKALLLYHLRKYAAALQATLVFVRAGTTAASTNSTTTNTNTNTSPDSIRGGPSETTAAAAAAQPTLTPAQLAVLWRAWALGQPIWQDTARYLEEAGLWNNNNNNNNSTTPALETTVDPANASTGDAAAPDTAVHALVYGPGHYQQDLLDSVLLRAAQYPGHWDAEKDSVWKILPPAASAPSTTSKPTKTTATAPTGSDQGWLQELRQSLGTASTSTTTTTNSEGASLTTPEPKKKKSTETPSKTPNEAAAFFESLLK